MKTTDFVGCVADGVWGECKTSLKVVPDRKPQVQASPMVSRARLRCHKVGLWMDPATGWQRRSLPCQCGHHSEPLDSASSLHEVTDRRGFKQDTK